MRSTSVGTGDVEKAATRIRVQGQGHDLHIAAAGRHSLLHGPATAGAGTPIMIPASSCTSKTAIPHARKHGAGHAFG
jgi:hypothetical protein